MCSIITIWKLLEINHFITQSNKWMNRIYNCHINNFGHWLWSFFIQDIIYRVKILSLHSRTCCPPSRMLPSLSLLSLHSSCLDRKFVLLAKWMSQMIFITFWWNCQQHAQFLWPIFIVLDQYTLICVLCTY